VIFDIDVDIVLGNANARSMKEKANTIQ
jgi:hypothetical protein